MAHNLQVGTTALYVSGEFDYTLESGDALYYGDSPGVSVSSNIGTLAAGDTIARASNSYIVSAGTSYVSQKSRPTPSGASIIDPADGGVPTFSSASKRFLMQAGTGGINIKNYGAVGDGVTDDVVAIQAAIDHADTLNPGTVVIPSGNFAISAALTIPGDNIHITGPGTITLTTDKACGIIAIGRTDLKFSDFTMIGSGKGNQPANETPPTAALLVNSGCGIVLAGCTDSLVENVTLDNHGGTTGTGDYNGVAAVYLTWGCERVTVSGCRLTNSRSGLSDDNYFLGTGGLNNKFINNYAADCRFGFGFDNGLTGGYMQCIGNTAEDCQQSGFDVNNTFAPTLIGNTATGCGVENSNSGFAVYAATVYGVFIGNTARENLGNGFKWDNSKENTISGNESVQNGRHGFYFNTAIDNVISGNVARKNSTAADVTYDNFHLVDNSTHNTLNANVARSDPADAARPRYGVNVSGADCESNQLIANDTYLGGQTAQGADTGTATMIFGLASSSGPIGFLSPLQFERAAATSAALNARVTADAAQRIIMRADGRFQWGDGANAADTTLYRSAANLLRTDDSLQVDLDLEVNGALNHDGSTVGFYGTAPVARQTGVAVDAAGIHAALVALGLITA